MSKQLTRDDWRNNGGTVIGVFRKDAFDFYVRVLKELEDPEFFIGACNGWDGKPDLVYTVNYLGSKDLKYIHAFWKHVSRLEEQEIPYENER